MNRKQRRQVTKMLGTAKKPANLQEKLELVRNNIIQGKSRHNEFVERIRVEEASNKEISISNEIADLATRIAKNESIPLIEALERAKNTINKKYSRSS